MLTVAIHFHEKGRYTTTLPDSHSKRKRKLAGYQLSKLNYRALTLVLPDHVHDIPRSRIVEYRYITLAEDAPYRVQHRYFLVDIEEEMLPQLKAITVTDHNPRIYLWRDDQWWSFPQLEYYRDGEMASYTITKRDYGSILNLGEAAPIESVETRQIEKTKVRLRETYEPSKGPGFSLATTSATDKTNPAGFPTTITGNGMVLEWKRGYDDKPECWWLRDEHKVAKAQSQTYQHYATLKATPRSRWSRGFKAWYFTGGAHPPQTWLDMVGYRTDPQPPLETAPAPDDGQSRDLVPLKLVEDNYGKHDWHFGNPDVWCQLHHATEKWYLFIANASLSERSVFGYKLQLSNEHHPEIQGDWIHFGIPDLDPDLLTRDQAFKRQSLYHAVRSILTHQTDHLPDVVLKQLQIPSHSECRMLATKARRQAKLEQEHRMQPYHHFHAMLRFQIQFEVMQHRLMNQLALPDIATPSLDDPWS